MKNLILFLFIFSAKILLGQDLPYTFYLSTQEFEELSDGMSLNNAELWDENSNFPVSFSFNFKVNDQDYSNINVWAGGIDFVGQGIKKLFVFFSPFGGVIIKDKGEIESLSPISYKEDVIDGNKVLIIQWKNAGFRDSPSNTVDEDDFVTYQVWLVENLNLIKIVYGPSHSTLETYGGSGEAQGPFTKLLIGDVAISPFGFADNPSYEFEDCSIPCYGHITGTPSEDLVYNFSLDIVDSNISIKKNIFSVYPNPTKGDYIILETDTNFDLSDYTIHLLNSSGNQIPFRYNRNSKNISLDLNNVVKGIYFIIIKSPKGDVIFNHKVLKL